MPSTHLDIDAAHITIGIKQNTLGLIATVVIEVPTDLASKQDHSFT